MESSGLNKFNWIEFMKQKQTKKITIDYCFYNLVGETIFEILGKTKLFR